MRKEFLENTAKWFNCSTNLSSADCKILFQQAQLDSIQEVIDVISSDNVHRVLQAFFGEQAQNLTALQIKSLCTLEIKLQGAIVDVKKSLPDDPYATITTKRAVGLYSYYHSSGQVREQAIVTFNLCSLWLLIHANLYFHEMAVANINSDPDQTQHGFFMQNITPQNKQMCSIDLGNLLLFRLSNASQLGSKLRANITFKDYGAADIETLLSLTPILSAFNIPNPTLQLSYTHSEDENGFFGDNLTETSKRIQLLQKLGYAPNDQTDVNINLADLSTKIKQALEVKQHIQARMQLTHNFTTLDDSFTTAECAVFNAFLPNILELKQESTDTKVIANTLTVAISTEIAEKRQVALALLAGMTHFVEMHAASGAILENTQLPIADKKNQYDFSLYHFDLGRYTKLLPLINKIIIDDLPDMLIELYLYLSDQRPLSNYTHYVALLADYAKKYLRHGDNTYQIPAACYITLEKLKSAQLEPENTSIVASAAEEEVPVITQLMPTSFNTQSSKVQLTLPDYPFEQRTPDALFDTKQLPVTNYNKWLKQAPVLTTANSITQPKKGDILFFRKVIIGSGKIEENGVDIEIKRLFEGSIDTPITVPAVMTIIGIPSILYGSNSKTSWTYASGICYKEAKEEDNKDIAFKVPAGSDMLIGQNDPGVRKKIFEQMEKKAGSARTTNELAGKIIEKYLKLNHRLPEIKFSSKNLILRFTNWLVEEEQLLCFTALNIDANLLESDANQDEKRSALQAKIYTIKRSLQIESLLQITFKIITDTYLHQFIKTFFNDKDCDRFFQYFYDECKRSFISIYEKAKKAKVCLAVQLNTEIENALARTDAKRTTTELTIRQPYNLKRLVDANEVLIHPTFDRMEGIFVNCRLNKYGLTPGLDAALVCAGNIKEAIALLPIKQERGDLPARPQLTYIAFFEPTGKAIRTKTLAELICHILPLEIENITAKDHKNFCISSAQIERYEQLEQQTQKLIACAEKEPVKTNAWESCAINWLMLRDEFTYAIFQSMLQDNCLIEPITASLKQYYETSNDSISTKIALTIRVLKATAHPDFTLKPSIRNFARSQLETRAGLPNNQLTLQPKDFLQILTSFILHHPTESQQYKLMELLRLASTHQYEATIRLQKILQENITLSSALGSHILKVRASQQSLVPPLQNHPNLLSGTMRQASQPMPRLPYYNNNSITKITGASKKLAILEGTDATNTVKAIKDFIRYIVPLNQLFSLSALQSLFYGNRYKHPDTAILAQELIETSCVSYDNKSELFKRVQGKDEIKTPNLEHFINITWLGSIETYLAKRWSGNLSITKIIEILLLINGRETTIQENFKHLGSPVKCSTLENRLAIVEKIRIIAIKDDQPIQIIPPSKLSEITPKLESSDQDLFKVLCGRLSTIQQAYATSIINRLKAVLNNTQLKQKLVDVFKLEPAIKITIKFLESPQSKFPFHEFMPCQEALPKDLTYATWDEELPGENAPRNDTQLTHEDWQRSPTSLLFFILNACMPRELTHTQTYFSRQFAKVADDYKTTWEKLIKKEQQTYDNITMDMFLNRYRFVALLFLNPVLRPDDLIGFNHDILLAPLLAISPPRIPAMQLSNTSSTPLNCQLDKFIPSYKVNFNLFFYTHQMNTWPENTKDKSDLEPMKTVFDFARIKTCKDNDGKMHIPYLEQFCKVINEAELPPLLSADEMLHQFYSDPSSQDASFKLARKFNYIDLQSELKSVSSILKPTENRSKKRKATEATTTRRKVSKKARLTKPDAKNEDTQTPSTSSSPAIFKPENKRTVSEREAEKEEKSEEGPQRKRARSRSPAPTL